MKARFRRRAGEKTVGIFMEIDPEIKELMDAYAKRAGVPKWAVVEAAIRAGRPGSDGLPEDWLLPTADAPLPGMKVVGQKEPQIA